MMSVDVLVACAVLQDHADQLSVLGNIITLRPGAETVSNILTVMNLRIVFCFQKHNL